MDSQTSAGEKRARRIESLIETLLERADTIPADALYREPRVGDWSIAKILAHVAEVLPYWSTQARVVAARAEDNRPFGRTHDDPDRIAAIEARGHDSPEQLVSCLRTRCAESTATLRAIPEAGWVRTASHARRGELSVEQIVDQFLIEHLDEHTQQAEATRRDLRSGAAVGGEPLSPEVLAYGLAMPSEPQVSPDGARIVYTLNTVDHETKLPCSQIWLCGIDGSQPRPLTPPDSRAAGARWSPDGAEIACTAARGAGWAILLLPPGRPEEARELTRHTQMIGDLAWSPEGDRIAYTTLYDPENPDEQPLPVDAAPRVRVTRRIDYKQDGRGFVGDVRSQIFVVDVAGGARRRLTTQLIDHHGPQWSPDGRCLSFHGPAGPQSGTQLTVIEVDSGQTKPVSPDGCPVQQWSWSPNGTQIVYAGDPGRTFQPEFFLCDLARGTTQRISADLCSLPAMSLAGSPSQPIWLSDHQVLFAATRAAASRLELLDTETGQVTLLHEWQARNSGLSADRAGRYVVQGQTSFAAIAEISVWDRESATARTITAHSAPVLSTHPPARWQRFEVQRGEFTIEAWLLLPPDFDPAKQYPLILDVHGGPTGNYGYGFMAHQQCLATNGFLLVYANPRGSSSYGGHFARQVFLDWGGEDFQDLLAVVDTVLERPYADRERTGIFGFSYGGYMTAWAITQTDRFRAAVCGEPFFDLESSYGTSMNGPGGINAHAGGPPHERREWYAAHSPSTFAHRTRTPTLIIQGEEDAICPIGQSEQMFVALKQAGCEVEFACYPGGSHMFFAFGLPEYRADFLRRTLAWFKDHLGEPV
jgi:dipeptidyl aminopeptidase/acylaminoacyl peptidase